MQSSFSLTIAGILVAVGGSVLIKVGFTEQCSNEIVQLAPVVIGGIMSWIGRFRKGDITVGGFRK